MKFISILILLTSFGAQAATEQFGYSDGAITIEKSRAQSGEFSEVKVSGFESSRKVGEPALPVKSMLLVGHPSDIHAQVQVIASQVVRDLKPMPVQAQICRCATEAEKQAAQRKFSYNESAYRSAQPFQMTYLGAFRGTPITRLDVNMARYEAATNSVRFLQNIKVQHNSQIYSYGSDRAADYKDYLIIAPDSLVAGTGDFVAWKKSQGYNVIVNTLHSPDLTLANISSVVAQSYKNNGTDFVIIVGDEDTVPMNSVYTSGGDTPSDLKYFTMDGANDNIPDIFYGRIAESTAAGVAATLQKAIEFDKHVYKNTQGLNRIIGIASNQGNNPSDNDYIKSIEDKFVTTLKYTASHFYQNDSVSNPGDLNKSISTGATWMMYVGHGSGYSWPSMGTEYEVSDISGISNADAVKPIVIDVACQNGRLQQGHFGLGLSSVLSSAANGVAAYYGGTVNVSWDPPAIMARGIAYEHVDKNFRHLGEALFAGQMYLAANWNQQSDVQDNFEWYHLQGDPGMIISH